MWTTCSKGNRINSNNISSIRYEAVKQGKPGICRPTRPHYGASQEYMERYRAQVKDYAKSYHVWEANAKTKDVWTVKMNNGDKFIFLVDPLEGELL